MMEIKMPPIKLDGKNLSKEIESSVKLSVKALKETYNIQPTLAIFLVGDHAASLKYVDLKKRACERVGISCEIEWFANQDTPQRIIEGRIRTHNLLPTTHGIMIQHPVPPQYDERHLFNLIAPMKDVDGLSAVTFGETAFKYGSHRCATARAIMRIFQYYDILIKGKIVSVVGCSPILGLPLSLMMQNDGATVVMCNIHTGGLPLKHFVRQADIVVGCCGVPNRIKAEWIDGTQTVIDCGYPNGDFEEEAYLRSKAYSPCRGGVGPVTVATLLHQTIIAAEKQICIVLNANK
jgi:methylenetetrahydrofolate dehydrogenase (NADP+) / methenyltetrahydrofolate cyclohydrolase